MATMTVALESPPVASSGRRQPKLVLRGRRRKGVQKLLKSLQSVIDADYREMIRGGSLGYEPYMFTGSWGSRLEKKMNDLIGECQTQLADRVA